MAAIVTSNFWTLQQLQRFVDTLPTFNGVWLYTNNLQPTPGNLLSDFIEPSFPGYNRQSLFNMFNPIVKVQDGQFIVTTKPITFSTFSTSIFTVYGWLIAGAPNWLLASAFPQPLVITSGSPITFTISIIAQSLSVGCP
jgi:hypothetical protein